MLPWMHPARVAALEDALARRILVIDGAMGTMIQRHELQEADYRGERFAEGYDAPFAAEGHAHGPGCGCEAHDQRGNNDLLTLTRPDIIRGIHAAYLEAGADLVETNTFNSTSVSLADYRLQHLVRELNREGAALARGACDDVPSLDAACDSAAGVRFEILHAGKPGAGGAAKAECERVFAFLGVAPVAVRVATERIVRVPPEALVLNYDELRAALDAAGERVAA